MRAAFLFIAGSVLVAGCSLFGDCESSTPDYSQQQPDLRIETAAVPVTDTLTVAVLYGGYFELDVGRRAETPASHSAPGLGIDFTSSGSTLPGALRSVVRNDTVFVGTEDAFGLYQLACSPSFVGARLDIDRVQAPRGVRAIRWTIADPFTAPNLPDAGLTDA